METYNKAKIGSRIAWAGDHFVYHYGTDEVIKFSKFDFLLGHDRAFKKAVDDDALCRKYFGDYLLETRIVASGDHKRIATIQPYVVGRHLTAHDLHHSDVKRHYRDLISRYHQLTTAENTWLDLIGQYGLWHGTVSNIFVTAENKLLLYDATLFDVHEFLWWQRPFLYPLLGIGRLAQEMTLRRFQRKLQI